MVEPRATESCDSTTSCTAGDCVDKVCVPKAKLGEACTPESDAGPKCAAWLECSGGRTCVRPEVLACR